MAPDPRKAAEGPRRPSSDRHHTPRPPPAGARPRRSSSPDSRAGPSVCGGTVSAEGAGRGPSPPRPLRDDRRLPRAGLPHLQGRSGRAPDSGSLLVRPGWRLCSARSPVDAVRPAPPRGRPLRHRRGHRARPSARGGRLAPRRRATPRRRQTPAAA